MSKQEVQLSGAAETKAGSQQPQNISSFVKRHQVFQGHTEEAAASFHSQGSFN